MDSRNGCRGLTLIELCACLAVVAILTGLAVPGLRTALRTAAIRAAAFEVLAGVEQARTGAIVQARPAAFCLSDLAGQCIVGNAPATAWSAFIVTGHAPLAGGALPPGAALRATRPKLTFRPDALSASTGTLTICDSRSLARPRAIIVSQTGRVRIADADPADCGA
jgi:type IV fimbrial biogenesis protein FimT